MVGDHGRLASEYCAVEKSGMSVSPFEDEVPYVVRPKPGAALKESHDTGRNCMRTLNACSLRPLVKLMLPTVTPVENRGGPSSVWTTVLSARLAGPD
jgi:hypothetical protein